MRVSRFYCASLVPANSPMQLPDEVFRHAVQVLRMKPGALLNLFDGQGLEYQAQLEQVDKRQATVSLQQQIHTDNESPLDILLMQGISRGERMDYAIQKAVELGVKRIMPVVTERCNVQLSGDRAEKRINHWQGVIISACEQSGRSYLPELLPIASIDSAFGNVNDACKLVLDPEAIKSFSSVKKAQQIALLIGPEGGLSETEVQRANDAGFTGITLGPRILRTETASAAALAMVQAGWGDIA
ncbi:16S rRNA (uracil(1498)-N(3))-methyltransferase [Methylophaga nitratireducenticrescens]|uniref:Ribosomal RNA small subunit methyltransferase E n=1 Tax=Methylophaga nitratireducenticrescens TaxID=754476 RepID=I1XLI2_METNJ|nr:16S rRNA (uracil(1498)-N(3))-methyltransferase [Methylophaga nitratireducenticrescens]AFI85251.1 16S rRNA (uracil(1498)-N(3))-methyltransferase [Methylophaga nitratireducenticrescens]AUZ85734.1 16S rRNA (uracil(1498)-N(3))-methyltransferase [Methylophaga nitratireducenticrescens]